MNRLAVAVLVLTFVAINPSSGLAQASSKPTAKQKRKAKSYVLRGNRFKAKGDGHRWKKRKAQAMKNYKKAAYVYLAAYRLGQQPAVIYKLANIYMVRGEMDWALRGYKRYMALKSAGSAADRAKRMIIRLERVVQGQRNAGTLADGEQIIDPTEVYGDKTEEPVKEPDPPEKTEPDPPKKDEPKPVTNKIVKVAKPKPPSPGKTFRLAGIGTAGTGVLLLILGMKFGLDASSASSDLSGNDDGWTADDRQRIEDGEGASNKMLLFSALGAAAIVGGSLLYLHGKKLGKRGRKEMTVAPALTPSSVSIAVMGRF